MNHNDPKNSNNGDHLPDNIEADMIDAMSGGPLSEALVQWLETHPDDAEMLDGYRSLSAEILDDRAASDPGEHFFEALHEDIARQIARPPAQVLTGGPAPIPQASGGWLERLGGWFAASPTAAWAGVMALALVAIAVWTISDGMGQNKDGSGVVIGTADAGNPDPADEVAMIKTPLDTDLSQSELAELRDMAAKLDLSQKDGAWDDDNGEDTWRSAPPGADLEGLTMDQLRDLDQALARSL